MDPELSASDVHHTHKGIVVHTSPNTPNFTLFVKTHDYYSYKAFHYSPPPPKDRFVDFMLFCFWLSEPYDYPSWCLILVFSVHATGASIFIFEWLSPYGLNQGLTTMRGNWGKSSAVASRAVGLGQTHERFYERIQLLLTSHSGLLGKCTDLPAFMII